MTPGAASKRVGCVKYLNARPLIDGWPEPIAFDHPSALGQQLASGALDLALVSSFELLRDPSYTAVDRVAIGSDGPVYSVFVASRGRLEDVRRIELDPASLTSVNLLRCLLEDRGLSIPFAPPSGQLPPDDCARLFIGDQAIRFRQTHATQYQFADLGELWRETTGMPFVYALWLLRSHGSSDKDFADRLRSLRDTNLNRIDALAESQTDFSDDFCRFYWRQCLRFDFGEREKAGLLHFKSLCEKHELLPRNAAPLKVV